MKKKLLLLTLTATLTLSAPINANAKTKSNYYTVSGIVRNFTYTMKYKNGEVLKGKGYNVYTKDGNIWEVVDTDTNKFFKDGSKVKVKLYNNKTKTKLDDRIVSIKKIKKAKHK